MKKLTIKTCVLILLLSGLIILQRTSEASVNTCNQQMYNAWVTCDDAYTSSHDVSAYSSCLSSALASGCTQDPDFCSIARQRAMECPSFEPGDFEGSQAYMACRNNSGIDQCQ